MELKRGSCCGGRNEFMSRVTSLVAPDPESQHLVSGIQVFFRFLLKQMKRENPYNDPSNC